MSIRCCKQNITDSNKHIIHLIEVNSYVIYERPKANPHVLSGRNLCLKPMLYGSPYQGYYNSLIRWDQRYLGLTWDLEGVLLLCSGAPVSSLQGRVRQ